MVSCLKSTQMGMAFCRLLAMACVVTPVAARANAVDYWSDIATQVAVAPPQSRAGLTAIDLAYVHIAIYDAVNAIDGRYSVFAVRPATNPLGASLEAATAAAANTILRWLYPSSSATAFLDGAYANYLLTIPDDTNKTRGIAVGTEVANAVITLRAGDGRNASVPYFFGPPSPGVYQQTPGGPATPIGPWVGQMQPFAIKSASQFRADGPPDVTSAQWAEDFNETKNYGALNNSRRTPLQTVHEYRRHRQDRHRRPIFGGMHYRTSGVHGSVIARKVAHYVARHYFQPE